MTKYLGVDYGEAKIGLATSDGEIAEPYGVVRQISQIGQICRENGISKIVIGMVEGKMGEKIREIGERIEELTGLSVDYQDETLSSHLAGKKMIESGKPRMKKKSSEHSIAAALLLQDYLDN